jgi:opacity protein-like surface antigen
MNRHLAGAGLSACLIATSASAQDMRMQDAGATRAIQFGIGGGAIVPRTNPRFQEVLTGATGQAYLLVRLSPGLPALRIGADFARMQFDDPQAGAVSGPVGSTRTQLGGIASLRVDLLRGPVRPYVLAGVGAFNIKDILDPTAGTVATSLSTTQVGIDGGAGLAFRLGRISGFVETRLQNIYTRQQGLIDTNAIRNFPITFGLLF